MHALLLGLSLVSAQITPGPDQPPPPPHPVPWYLPRTASLGVMVVNAVTPHFRLGWELTIVEQPRNNLVLLVHLGSGVAVSGMEEGMRSLYQHVALAGIGYRMNLEHWQWGFEVAVGPMWYRASWDPSVRAFEQRVQGFTEGAVRAGARLKPNLFIGGFAGLGTTWEVLTTFAGARDTGGFRLGVYADWR